MKAKILNIRPDLDWYPETWFDNFGVGNYILFEDSNYEDWLGVFSGGEITDFTKIILFEEKSFLLIIFQGQGYLININSRQLFFKTKCDCLVDAIKVPEQDLVIACDFTNLYAFTNDRDIWTSSRLSSDGIQLVESTNEFLIARAWIMGKWCDFKLIYDGWLIEGNEDFLKNYKILSIRK